MDICDVRVGIGEGSGITWVELTELLLKRGPAFDMPNKCVSAEINVKVLSCY